jgi:hypothetical protein
VSAGPPLRELQNGQGAEPEKGRIYACNRTDDRSREKALPTTCGESPYTLLGIGTECLCYGLFHKRLIVEQLSVGLEG